MRCDNHWCQTLWAYTLVHQLLQLLLRASSAVAAAAAAAAAGRGGRVSDGGGLLAASRRIKARGRAVLVAKRE